MLQLTTSWKTTLRTHISVFRPLYTSGRVIPTNLVTSFQLNWIFCCRPVDTSGHPSQNQPGPPQLFWTMSHTQAASSGRTGWTSSNQIGSPAALCRPVQTAAILDLWTNQEPSSVSSKWTGWTGWTSNQTGYSLLKIHPSCLLHYFTRMVKTSEGASHRCHPCNSRTGVSCYPW